MGVRGVYVSGEYDSTADQLAAAQIQAIDDQTAVLKELVQATWVCAALNYQHLLFQTPWISLAAPAAEQAVKELEQRFAPKEAPNASAR